MPHYRIYLLDAADRIARPPFEADCPDDDAAMASARAQDHAFAAEVWCGPRFVARLEPASG